MSGADVVTEALGERRDGGERRVSFDRWSGVGMDPRVYERRERDRMSHTGIAAKAGRYIAAVSEERRVIAQKSAATRLERREAREARARNLASRLLVALDQKPAFLSRPWFAVHESTLKDAADFLREVGGVP